MTLGNEELKVFLCTANVGTVFENVNYFRLFGSGHFFILLFIYLFQLDTMMEPWLTELTNVNIVYQYLCKKMPQINFLFFEKKISQFEPDFVAIHMQEMGGKQYKESMQSVDTFFK